MIAKVWEFVGDFGPQLTPAAGADAQIAAAANISVPNQPPALAEYKQLAPKMGASTVVGVAPVGARDAGTVDLDRDVLVLGGGPEGYSAVLLAAD